MSSMCVCGYMTMTMTPGAPPRPARPVTHYFHLVVTYIYIIYVNPKSKHKKLLCTSFLHTRRRGDSTPWRDIVSGLEVVCSLPPLLRARNANARPPHHLHPLPLPRSWEEESLSSQTNTLSYTTSSAPSVERLAGAHSSRSTPPPQGLTLLKLINSSHRRANA